MAYQGFRNSEERGRGRGRGNGRGTNNYGNFRQNLNSNRGRTKSQKEIEITRNSFNSQNKPRTFANRILESVPSRGTPRNQGNRLTPNDDRYISHERPMSIPNMKILLNKMLEDEYLENIPLKLLDPLSRFLNFLNFESNQDSEIIKTIFKVIIKASENKLMEMNFRDLLRMVLGTQFAKKRLDKVISIELISNFDFEMFKLLIAYLKLNFEIIPGLAYDVFYNRVYNLNHIMDTLLLRTDNISQEIIKEFDELKELALASSIPSPIKERDKFKNPNDDIAPPDDFKTISIFPTSQDLIDIRSHEVFLRKNKSRGSYQSVDHYLDVQFRLMREDFIQPLREGLSVYKSGDQKKRMNIRVYKNVSLLNSLPSERLGVIHNLRFDRSRLQKVKWAQTKRFLYGSLLCLSCDNFKTLLFCTIANREIRDLENGILSVKFHESKPSKDEVYTLLETTNMFESYKHVLLKLQDTNENSLCMKNYLVYSEVNIEPPSYLVRNKNLEYSFKSKRIWPGDNNLEWPRAVDLDMDESQFQAFKSSLTKEITIIQGPPGTGKTYLGLNICECLLKNVQTKILGFGPILIVCYTNHALDQFLEGISNFTDKIVRIGSRCKSEKLQQFSLINWKKRFPSKEYSRQKWSIFSNLKELKDQLIYKQAALKSAQEKLISLDKLKVIVADEQLSYLKMIGLQNWLYGESFANETFDFQTSADNIVEWLMYEEIIQHVNQIVIDAQTELLKENEDFYDEDMDNEVNYINNQRRLDIDEEDISDLNNEFNRIFDLCSDPNEILHEANDGFTMVRNKTTKRLFQSRLRSYDKMTQERAMEIPSLDRLSIEDRWNLYRYWRSKYTEFLYDTSEQLEIDYNRLSDQINEIHFDEDRSIMKDQCIIGMTTTGAARYNKVLSAIKCKIIIVEEAAEVLESHIIGSLNPGCEHLILIGDHKQLKPNPAVFELAKKYDLDLSLFERLINNNMHFSTLLKQHRMRPEIAELMNFIYQDLQNHESVFNYPNVPAVGKNLFFIDHFEKEENNDDIMSYSNPFEAEFIVKFCRHLMKNGVDRTRMTILTLYSGQMFLLKKKMDRNIFEGVRVCVVDNYQGEENDIILLSLVRSNEYEKIGFLSIENRICVSLSRAKHGLFVFGNFQILANQNDMWKQICQSLKRKGVLSSTLNLLCQNHPEKKLVVSKPPDFDKYPEGGCEELCNQRLNCGHACRKSCHFLDKNHENNKCVERCTRLCCNGHRCDLKCYQECNSCTKQIEKRIPTCNHSQLMACFKIPDENDCRNKCDRILLCGHVCLKSCREKCDKCLTKIQKQSIECGHLGQYYCSDNEIQCTKPCGSILGCEHQCVGTCGSCYMGRLHETCQHKCQSQLICGHACNAKCSLHCPPCQNRCEEGCTHNACPNACGEKCVPCYEKCKWKCKHMQCKKLCYEFCDRFECNESCDRLLDCEKCKKRFKCYGVCGEPCRKVCLNCDPEVKEIFFGTEDEKNAKFITLWTCNHSFEVNSMDTYMQDVPENEEIITKKCPKCNTIINKRSCFRYLNTVKKISLDIKKVQQQINDNLETIKYPEFSKMLAARGHKISRIFKKYNLVNYFEMKGTLSQFMVMPYHTSLQLVDEVYQKWFNRGGDIRLPYVDKCVSNLIVWLNPTKRKFNQFEIDQYNSEFDRLDLISKINQVKSENSNLKEIDNYINELKTSTFTKQIADEFKHRWVKFVQEKLYLPNMQITEYQRNEIVKAIGLNKGRWFKCQQGHFYVIGECGGATQIAKCPECHLEIGGVNHQLVAGNRFAPEIDNANGPAWPGMNNNL